jgi:hypothetical protein
MLHMSIYICHIRFCIYVTYLHKHIWHTPNNICYLYVYTYKLRKPALFTDRRWSGKETGFLSLVCMYMYCIYPNTKVTYVHIRNLTHQKSDVPFFLFHICTWIYVTYMHLHMSPTYINIHMWKIHICMHMSYICGMYTCIIAHGICICIYVHMLPTCIYTCVTYIHITYVTYIHILHTYICGPYSYRYVTYRHVMHVHIERYGIYIHYVYMSHMYLNMYIWHLRTYIHMLPMYICIYDIDAYVTCVQMSIHT